MKNGNIPAMPIEFSGFGQHEPEAHAGLTKREMFAMHAMHGLLAANGAKGWLTGDGPVISVRIADALLAELEKQEKQQ